MFALLFALLIHGHHYGWQQPHNPHHRPPCAVAFHIGCASLNPPPTRLPFPVPPPVLPGH
jgi:hypothetical protein